MEVEIRGANLSLISDCFIFAFCISHGDVWYVVCVSKIDSMVSDKQCVSLVSLIFTFCIFQMIVGGKVASSCPHALCPPHQKIMAVAWLAAH